MALPDIVQDGIPCCKNATSGGWVAGKLTIYAVRDYSLIVVACVLLDVSRGGCVGLSLKGLGGAVPLWRGGASVFQSDRSAALFVVC